MPTRSSSKSTGWIGAPDADKATRKTTAAAAKKAQQQEEEEELEDLEQKIKTLESHMKEKGAKFRSVLYSEPYDDEDPRGDPHATHGELVFDLEERFLKLKGLNEQWLIQQQTLQRPHKVDKDGVTFDKKKLQGVVTFPQHSPNTTVRSF